MPALTDKQPFAQGVLGASGDTVELPISGVYWGSYRLELTGTFSQTVTFEVSTDAGVNWTAGAYGKRIDAVATNPSVQPSTNPGTGVGSAVNLAAVATSWEIPIAGDVTNVRARSSAFTSGAAQVRMFGYKRFVSGVPVRAVLADVTETALGAGVVIANATVDLTGWRSSQHMFLSPTGQVWSGASIGQDGTQVDALPAVAGSSAASGSLMLSEGTGTMGLATFTGGEVRGAPALPQRFGWSLPTTGTVTLGRIRVLAVR